MSVRRVCRQKNWGAKAPQFQSSPLEIEGFCTTSRRATRRSSRRLQNEYVGRQRVRSEVRNRCRAVSIEEIRLDKHITNEGCCRARCRQQLTKQNRPGCACSKRAIRRQTRARSYRCTGRQRER